jgi:hypothetical protein
MQFVTLVNRTSKMLECTWDGRHYDIGPGEHSFPEIQALKFKEQHPLMGSEDPRTLNKIYLMGIKELNDDCTPLEQSKSLTLQDMSEKLDKGEVKVVRGNGLYNPFTDGSLPLTNDSSFVKP